MFKKLIKFFLGEEFDKLHLEDISNLTQKVESLSKQLETAKNSIKMLEETNIELKERLGEATRFIEKFVEDVKDDDYVAATQAMVGKIKDFRSTH